MSSNTVVRTQTVSEIGRRVMNGRMRLSIPAQPNEQELFQSFNFTIDCGGNMHVTHLSGAHYKTFGPNDEIRTLADA